jgi:hypothetical protein
MGHSIVLVFMPGTAVLVSTPQELAAIPEYPLTKSGVGSVGTESEPA